MTKQKKPQSPWEHTPSVNEVQAELAKAQSMDDFFGKRGAFNCQLACVVILLLSARPIVCNQIYGYKFRPAVAAAV